MKELYHAMPKCIHTEAPRAEQDRKVQDVPDANGEKAQVVEGEHRAKS